ncbi:hypothetical protein VFPFJ_00546 [Purpureocillium lilacinum]|uniref:Uncharacterized protein n=1 Tax=Purpureocillium lilacinum TaxID=33203 RepID=A0A179HVN5_PURLI|nr:hypothetical protein VFPFJ_00546 [Purpureocillium lilacinum]OAQ86474.1 hypothetical protein VFPBJ_00514 [Purpureocillium lilacinum]OAQ94437.1 hypothetical protein VFPFJ_00546 [Purpureocillium lilacinum]
MYSVSHHTVPNGPAKTTVMPDDSHGQCRNDDSRMSSLQGVLGEIAWLTPWMHPALSFGGGPQTIVVK